MINGIRLIACLLSTAILVLAGCENHSEPTLRLSVRVPESEGISNRSLASYEGAGVEIRVNEGPSQDIPKQNDGTWVTRIELGNINEPLVIDALWYVVVDGVRYDAARQTQTLPTSPAQQSYNLDAPYVDSPYDHDGDLVSNLEEINAGGFPVPSTLIPEMVPVTPPDTGCFTLGSPSEEHLPFGYDNESQTEVCGLNNFSVGKYEVTFAQYDVFANASTEFDLPDDNGWGRGELPVINVNWAAAQEYTIWLSTITGKSFRLPTEAEWEYAARSGTTTRFHTGATINTIQANFSDPNPVVPYQENDQIGGLFVHDGDGQWLEYDALNDSVTGATTFTQTFRFEELMRDAAGIVIRDAVRDIAIRLSVDTGEIFVGTGTTADTLFYTITEFPDASNRLTGLQTVAVGSFPGSSNGIHDIHGNVFEWTCSLLSSKYNGSEHRCVDAAPDVNSAARMIKRGGSWKHTRKDIRSANRGWNNEPARSDIFTGLRVASQP